MLRGSAQRQERVLLSIGGAVVLCIAVAVSVVVVNPFGGRAEGVYSVVISTPYVGQGAEAGTAVVLHGVKVGQVTNVTNMADGGVQLDTDLQTQPTRGLTDKVSIDFRPINYFGVPGINLVPNPGGGELTDGSRLTLTPSGNFTLSELLNQLGNVSEASLTPQLIKVIDRVTRYTDGLNPLFETAVTVARAVEAVQIHPTDEQLVKLSSAVEAAPPFVNEAIIAGRRIIDYSYYPGQVRGSAAASGPKLEFPFLTDVDTPSLGDISPEFYMKHWDSFLSLAQNGLFGAVGKLVSSHVDDLTPLISGIKAITDTGPALLRPQDVAQKLSELRSRFESLYAGNGTQHAISVRILLDSLPAVASSVGIATEGTP
ncbi:mammalian cell entry protein [Mycolicibacterium sp. J2]|uniref:mammalian cell entry protein n=1 Tax=Mycolicibacterium sp. J2 TaxID=2993511 RepID=UPI00224A80B4|nr:mammalian cell entry protein [Mycolicibacterium sp. J2]MCX2712005.1 mammalian cell entry protein [Mycolicibacterium sp. J2]